MCGISSCNRFHRIPPCLHMEALSPRPAKLLKRLLAVRAFHSLKHNFYIVKIKGTDRTKAEPAVYFRIFLSRRLFH